MQHKLVGPCGDFLLLFSLVPAHVLQGPMVQVLNNPGLQAQGNANVVVSFTGLKANMDYQLRLIAVDASGNCQTNFTLETIHTLDNVPPVTLALDVSNVKGTSADLLVMLDEPGYVMYTVLQQSAAGASCPNAEEVGAQGVASATMLEKLKPLQHEHLALCNMY